MHTGKACGAVGQGAQRGEARVHGAAMYVAEGEMREGVALGVRERSRAESEIGAARAQHAQQHLAP